MKFIYLGCEGAPSVSRHFGVEFTIGAPVEIADKAVIAKLKGHQHFKAVEDGGSSASAAIDSPAADSGQQAAAVEQASDPLDSMGKGQLEAIGRELGIEVDKRKSLAFIRDQVRAARDATQGAD